MRERVIELLKKPWGVGLDPLVRKLALEVARNRRGGAHAGRLDRFYGGHGAGQASQRPLLLGHRGAMARAPENTLGAFKAALDDGGDGIELDVQLSADSIPVVLHDDTLDRTSTATGAPIRFEASELDDIDVGTWFPGWEHEKVPRLVEVFSLMHERAPHGAIVNVELKGPTPLSLGLERRVVEVVRSWADRVHVVISSFHPAQLLVVQRLAPEIPVALLLSEGSLMPLRTAWAAPLLLPDALHPPSGLVDAELVAAAHQAGMRVHVWAVRDAADADRLLELGVDGLIVDDVKDIHAVFERRYGPRVSPGSSSSDVSKSRASAP